MVSFALSSAAALAASCGLLLVASAAPALRQADPSTAPCPITNVCFVIDQSGSINSAEFAQEQSFVNEIATQIKGLNPATQLSAVAFASSAVQIQAPTPDLSAFTTSINGPKATSGGTRISSGLIACREPLDSLAGNRIIVLVTDGQGDNARTETEADLIRDTPGMFLLTVAIDLPTSGVDFLRTIAHAPEFALQSDFDQLPQNVADVTNSICTVVTTVGPPTTNSTIPTYPSGTPPVVVSGGDCRKAYDTCMFKFEGDVGLSAYDVLPDNQDSAFTPAVVSKDPTQRIGLLNSNGIVPEFITAAGAKLITDFGSQAFTPSHFKPFWTSNSSFVSGIGHQTFQGDQAAVAKDKCVRVYFSSFQVVSNVGGHDVVVDNRHVQKSENKCVVFQTRP